MYVGETCHDGRPITESWKYQEAIRLGIPIVHVSDRAEAEGTLEVEAEAEEKTVNDVKETKGRESWVEKYRPKETTEVIGHRTEIQQLQAWLASWSMTQEKKGVLITGPPGIGKTTVIHLLAKEAGYAVTEYNASDTRSVGSLRGQFALGMRRLRREVIVMDEVDGLSERGGVAEVAAIIKRTTTPIFCIANERGPKLKPLAAVCLEMRFSRPVRSTIATGLGRMLRAEGVTGITKEELEGLCERNGNDIRAIVNQLEFRNGIEQGQGQSTTVDKDACHRMEPFSVTQRLFANKRMSWAEATDLVFVDYHLIPFMIQEAYVHAGRDDIEAVAAAAEDLSRGDGLTRRVYQTQDWGLIPHALAASVMAVKRVPGGAPFQIFPQLLGKRSKQRKHERLMMEMARRLGCATTELRLDRAEPLRRVLVDRLQEGVGGAVEAMDQMGITRDDWWECLEETGLAVKGEKGITEGIPTALRSALTREWNKTHEDGDGIRQIIRTKGKGKSGKKTVKMEQGKDEEQDQEEDQEEEEQEEVDDF